MNPAAILLFLMGVFPALADGIADQRPQMLPDGEVVFGQRNISAAWLTGPTERYRHGILGDAIEASGLAVELAGGRVLSLELGPDSVFEDRFVRLADLDRDGTDEIIVVRSYLDTGAALAVMGIRDDRVTVLAESPAIGLPHRWLNPVGAADFDGDGTTEIAIVRTPHIGGILILYKWEDDRLVEVYRESDFSNHAMGSRELGLSAIMDANADGIPDITLPDASRRNLRIVTFAQGRFTNIRRIAHTSPIISKIRIREKKANNRPAILYSLADGTTRQVTLGK